MHMDQYPDLVFYVSGYVSLKTGFLFVYNLVQFLGFSWIFVNMTVRLFIFGKGKNSNSAVAKCFVYYIIIIIIISRNPHKDASSLFSDSLYDTFHTISDVMCFCQILTAVEVLNAAFGVVRTGVIPTLIQV